jgi:hypothetical protein
VAISLDGLRFILASRAAGVDLRRPLMIGRLSLDVSELDLVVAARRYGLPWSRSEARTMLVEADGFCEPFLRRLGARAPESLDASAFEGSSIVHDLNQPISEALAGRYSAVIDGGTLEHVFDFPTAIHNCMRLVAPEGDLLLMTPANNHLGHGFYQFSPELFFRLLSPDNGFRVERMLLKDTRRWSSWWEVGDPASGGWRGEVTSCRAQVLYIRARRIGDVDVDLPPPQQSDYASAWARAGVPQGAAPASAAGSTRTRIRRTAGAPIRKLGRFYDPWLRFGFAKRRHDRAYFRKVSL